MRKFPRVDLHVQIQMNYKPDPSDKRESAADTKVAPDDEYGSDFDSPKVSPVPTDDESGSESEKQSVMSDFYEVDSDCDVMATDSENENSCSDVEAEVAAYFKECRRTPDPF